MIALDGVSLDVGAGDRIAVMTPRPGRIARLLDIELLRPRHRTDRRFTERRSQLLEMLHLTGGVSGARETTGDTVAG